MHKVEDSNPFIRRPRLLVDPRGCDSRPARLRRAGDVIGGTPRGANRDCRPVQRRDAACRMRSPACDRAIRERGCPSRRRRSPFSDTGFGTRVAFAMPAARHPSPRRASVFPRPGECLARLWPSSRFDVHVWPYIYAPFAEAIRPSPPPALGAAWPVDSGHLEFRADRVSTRTRRDRGALGRRQPSSLVARPFSSRGRARDVTVRSRASLVRAGVPDDRV